MPDQRFDYLCELYKPPSKVPAFLHVTDIAGLIKGASEGRWGMTVGGMWVDRMVSK